MKKLDDVIVFTDGSCIRKRGVDPKCGYGIYFPNGEIDNISKPFIIGEPTNQRAELYAIYKAIKSITNVYEFERINIYTDSEYSIKSLTIWIHNWKKNGWKNSKKEDVANQDIIKKIDKYMMIYKNKIHLHHVRSHTGKRDAISKGNAMADTLAQRGSADA